MSAAPSIRRAERFLTQEEAWARRALTRASLAWWTASLSGRRGDYQRMERADRAVNRHYSRFAAYERLLRLLESPDADGLTRRRLQRQVLAYRSKQAPVEMLDRITRAEAEVQETYSTFRAPFEAMKADLDRHLAERFKLRTRDLRPWHYGDPFFQETPEVFAPPADPLYAQRDVVGLAAETYRQLGFRNIDAILARSDLYPRQGKNQHAYAVDIDREGDVRTFLNVERNARWMNTLLHELGHTIYQDGIDRTELPYDLRDDPQGFVNEGFAMFCEQPTTNPVWLHEMVGLPAVEADRLAPQLAAQETASLLAFVRWCLTIVHFERQFYSDPDQDLNRLWWDLEERYQGVPRADGRDAPDWAAKVHVATAPVYYQKYLLGRLFSAQLTQKMDSDLGGWWQGRPKSGDYIKRELFMPGARYPWPELVERVTGQPLGVQALAAA